MLAWVCCRGVGTRGIVRLRQGKSGRFYQEAEASSMPVTIHALFIHAYNLSQGPESAYANQRGALSKVAPVFKAGVGCTGYH